MKTAVIMQYSYLDRVIITYNFTDPIEPHKITTNNINETERQIDSAFQLVSGSYIFPVGAPYRVFITDLIV